MANRDKEVLNDMLADLRKEYAGMVKHKEADSPEYRDHTVKCIRLLGLMVEFITDESL